MARPGRAAHDPEAAKWPPLVFRAAAALGAAEQAILPAAIAVEFLIAALDVFDDVIDQELEDDLPSNLAVNAGIALATLSSVALRRLQNVISPERNVLIRRVMDDAVLQATRGEDQDIRFERQPLVTEDDAYQMTVLKSGSLVSMAFVVAGALMTVDREALATVGALGKEIGTLFQLQNDAGACTATLALESTDIRLKKKTVPIAYALQCAARERRDDILCYFSDIDRHLAPPDLSTIQTYLQECGALHYTWTVSEAVRQLAQQSLPAIAAAFGETAAIELEALIPQFAQTTAVR